MGGVLEWISGYEWFLIFGVIQLGLLLVVVIAWLKLQRLQKGLSQERYASVKPGEEISLQELIDQARIDQLDTLNIVLGEGAYMMDESLRVQTPIKLFGKGATETKIVSQSDQPALRIQDVKNCSLTNIRVEGAIQCSNSELLLENCHIIAKEDGICIEAEYGAVVTFSGVMRGDGGIAIRARGESKVILKPPYAVSGEDYVIKDPRSEVRLSQQNEQPIVSRSE